MKRAAIMTLVLTVLGLALAAGAAERNDLIALDSSMFTEPKVTLTGFGLNEPEPSMPKTGGNWGGFGGPMVAYLDVDLSCFDPVSEYPGTEGLKDGMALVGGFGGAVYKNFKFGGFGFGGNTAVSGAGLNSNREVLLTIGGGGVFLEYDYPVSGRLGVLAGAWLGAGRLSLNVKGLDSPPIDSRVAKWTANGPFFMAEPYLGGRFNFTDWFWLQLDLGYLYLDLDSSDFTNYGLGMDMADDDVNGAFQATLKIVYGFDPRSSKKSSW